LAEERHARTPGMRVRGAAGGGGCASEAATHNRINDIFSTLEGSFPQQKGSCREGIMEGFVHQFTIDGLAIQYWMLWVMLIVAGSVAWGLWRGKQHL
jgi:hypothetical protein